MRRIVVSCFAVLMALGAGAQVQPKKWSVIPRIGVNFSNLSDMDIYYGDGYKNATPRTMTDLIVGAEFDYRVQPAVEVGVGAYYSRQGCHYKNYYDTYTTSDPDMKRVEGWENNNVHLQYLNIPVTGTLHLSDNVALKAGVQCGVYLSGNQVYDLTVMNVKNGKSEIVTSTHIDEDQAWLSANTVWSIPIGVEFEYENVLVDISYAIPLTYKDKKVWSIGDEATFHKRISNGRNKVLSMTVGYRF